MTKIKAKTRRSVAKRFASTGSGRLKRRRAFRSHLLTSKKRKRKRKSRQMGMVHSSDQPGVKRLLPYA